jgi:hypothetical protein
MQSLVPVDCRICYGTAEMMVAVVVQVEGYSEDSGQLMTRRPGLSVLQGYSRLLLRPVLVSSSLFDRHDDFHQEYSLCSPVDIFDRAKGINVSIALIGCPIVN